MLLILHNERNDTLLGYGQNISNYIETMMKNMHVRESDITEFNSLPITSLSKKIDVDQNKSESLQIKYAVNLINNIMLKGAYKTNMADKVLIKKELLEGSTLSNKLDLLIISLKRLYNNFHITLREKIT